MSHTNSNSLRFEEVERNPLVVIDIATLKSLLGNVIENALSGWQSSAPTKAAPKEPHENDLMDMEEVVKFLKVSKVTIHNWKRNGTIKSHKIGRKLYFKKSEIISAIHLQKYSIK